MTGPVAGGSKLMSTEGVAGVGGATGAGAVAGSRGAGINASSPGGTGRLSSAGTGTGVSSPIGNIMGSISGGRQRMSA